jgi:class 3 adenylate cyclase
MYPKKLMKMLPKSNQTVNTASRIESTGLPNRIHISQDTAELLVEAAKGHWVTAREELVSAKGKG